MDGSNIEEVKYLSKPVTLRTWIRKDKGLPTHKAEKIWKFKELDEWI